MVFMTPERSALQGLAREFAMERVLPLANELDPVEGEMPPELITEMAAMGFFGILVPESLGGLGLGVVEYAMITEELARCWMSVASIIRASSLIPPGLPLRRREELLRKVAQGRLLGAFALSEAEAGSDAANIQCRAHRDGDGWRIRGTKMWCTYADGADFIVVFARTSPPPTPQRRHVGISAFYVEKKRGELPEGIRGSTMKKIGYHGWKTWELHFDDFSVPGAALVGEEGDGFYAGMGQLDVARVHTAARSVGLARGALEDSIAYAKVRMQFGQPIASFQSVRFKIATMAADIEAARQLTLFAADEIDAGHSSRTTPSMAKLVASEMAERVTSEGIQIHGGAGLTKEFPLERYWREARMTKILEGTSEIQMRIVSDQLLGRLPRPTSNDSE